MLRKEDRPTYATAVWDTFRAKHQPGRLTMSSAEFQVVSRWMDRGLSLPVVLRAMDEFTGKARRLEAMEGPVERAFAYWRNCMGAL